MSVDNRIIVSDTLDLMIRYCNDVAYIRHRIGTIDNLNDDITYQYALAGAVQQIGESARRIDIWLDNHSDYNWSKVIGMRNILSHRYHKLDKELLWIVSEKRVPEVLQIIMDLKDNLGSYPDEDFLNIGSKRSDRHS